MVIQCGLSSHEQEMAHLFFEKLMMVGFTFIDINDNALFLDVPCSVIWGENKPSGMITKPKARDYDSEENGSPFEFKIDSTADDEIRSKFDARLVYTHE